MVNSVCLKDPMKATIALNAYGVMACAQTSPFQWNIAELAITLVHLPMAMGSVT